MSQINPFLDKPGSLSGWQARQVSTDETTSQGRSSQADRATHNLKMLSTKCTAKALPVMHAFPNHIFGSVALGMPCSTPFKHVSEIPATSSASTGSDFLAVSSAALEQHPESRFDGKCCLQHQDALQRMNLLVLNVRWVQT